MGLKGACYFCRDNSLPSFCLFLPIVVAVFYSLCGGRLERFGNVWLVF